MGDADGANHTRGVCTSIHSRNYLGLRLNVSAAAE
jgi:hypothetical protein